MSDPVLNLVKWSGVSKVRTQALRHSLAVLGMQTDLPFAKIICEFFVLIPKLAFVSRRKVNFPGSQVILPKSQVGNLDGQLETLASFLKVFLASFFTFFKRLHHFLAQWIRSDLFASAARLPRLEDQVLGVRWNPCLLSRRIPDYLTNGQSFNMPLCSILVSDTTKNKREPSLMPRSLKGNFCLILTNRRLSQTPRNN